MEEGGASFIFLHGKTRQIWRCCDPNLKINTFFCCVRCQRLEYGTRQLLNLLLIAAL